MKLEELVELGAVINFKPPMLVCFAKEIKLLHLERKFNIYRFRVLSKLV